MPKRKVRRARRKRGVAAPPAVRRSATAADSVRGAMSGLAACQKRLLAERAALDAKLSAVEQALRALGAGATPTAGVRRRGAATGEGGFRAGSLKEYIAKVLTGRGVMSVKDITQEVLNAGYQTRNRTLAKSVGIALTQMKGVRKVGRGRFKLG